MYIAYNKKYEFKSFKDDNSIWLDLTYILPKDKWKDREKIRRSEKERKRANEINKKSYDIKIDI